MANSIAGVEQYLKHWLKTATNGEVTYALAWAVNRMRMHCHVCGGFGTFDMPSSDKEVDWQVQEFVKFHSTNGPHLGTQGAEWVSLKPTHVTADMKPIIAKSYWSKMDADKQKAALLQNNLESYKASLKSKYKKSAEIVEELKKSTPGGGKLISFPANGWKFEQEYKPLSMKPDFDFGPDRNGNDFTYVKGRKIYWKRDAEGRIIGVDLNPPSKAPAPVPAPPKVSIKKGRKFR